jgi:hypothetical protein
MRGVPRVPPAAAAHADRLGARATLRVIEHADQSLHVLRAQRPDR